MPSPLPSVASGELPRELHSDMVTKRTAKPPLVATGRVEKSRASLSVALMTAASVHGLSQEGTARDVGVDARTVRRWFSGEVAMDVERVAAAPIIGKTFRRIWCSEGHDAAPYVARKRRGPK